MAYRWIVALLLSLLLAACSSGQKKDGDDESPERRAAEVNTQLGQSYMSQGDYEIALDKLKKAVRSDDSYAPAHTVLAVLYERIGETESAGEHYRKAVKADPENGDVNNNYGSFLCRSGEARDTDKYFLKALDDPFYSTPAVAMANAGSCAMERGEADKAETYLRQSLAYDPKFPDALLGMAELKYQSEDFLSARGFLQRYEAESPMTPQSLMSGYRVETALDNPEDARRYANRLLELFPNTRQAREIRKSRF